MSVIWARISGVLRSSCIYSAVKLTTKNTKDTENFGLFFRSLGDTCDLGAPAASPQCSAACRAQIPVGRRRRSVRAAHVSRVLAMTSRHRGLLRRDCFGETPKPARETRALPRNRSERSMRNDVFSRYAAYYC